LITSWYVLIILLLHLGLNFWQYREYYNCFSILTIHFSSTLYYRIIYARKLSNTLQYPL
jgi:hypothetical protein